MKFLYKKSKREILYGELEQKNSLVVFNFLEQPSETENIALEDKFLVNDFHEMLEVLRKEEKTCIGSITYIFADNEYLFIVSNKAGVSKPVLKYKFENTEIRDFFHLIICGKKECPEFGKGTVTTITREFQIFCRLEALEVILSFLKLKGNGEEPYSKYIKHRPGKKDREITCPNDSLMKPSLRKLNAYLQLKYDKINYDLQVAYKKGNSIKTNAKMHVDQKFCFNIDIHHFFPSCKRQYIKKYIDFMFFLSPNKEIMEEYFLDAIVDTTTDGLSMGNPISGCLANAILSIPIKILKNLTEKTNVTVSDYSDDITFSSNKKLSSKYCIDMFNTAFAKAGMKEDFILNEEKLYGGSGGRRKVTGVVINHNSQLTCPRNHYYRKLRAMIYQASLNSDSVNMESLKGKISFALMLDETGKVKKYLNKFPKLVKKYHLLKN